MFRFQCVLAALAVSNIAVSWPISCVRENTDFAGADLGSLNVATFQDCERLCLHYDNCESITYHAASLTCYFKYRRGGAQGPSSVHGLVSMNMKCGNLKSDTSCARIDVDFAGADIGSTNAGTLEACERFCRDSEGCVSITFRASSSTCWLKHKRGGERGPTTYPGLVSLNMYCDKRTNAASCKVEHTDFGGADLTSLSGVTLNQCEALCRDAYQCVSFTHRQSDGGCWLKNRRYGANGPSYVNGLVSMNIDC